MSKTGGKIYSGLLIFIKPNYINTSFKGGLSGFSYKKVKKLPCSPIFTAK